jgi:small subunit ribosomal protein S16
MSVKIRLKRFGKKRSPFYRVVVMDSHTKRDGRAIEEIGKYHPTEEPSVIEIDSARALYWLGVGAQPSEQVVALLKLTGDWQRFRGEKGAMNTVKPQVAKASAEDKIKEAAKAGERAKAAKAAEREKAAKAKAAEEAAQAKAAAEAAAAAKTAAVVETPAEPDTVADESHEVPSDEGSEVEVEIAEGDPSDAGDKVEGIIDEAKVEG